MNLPNKISLFRISLVPLLVISFSLMAYPHNYVVSLFIFVMGTISDVLDGYIARRDGLITVFGKFIDPIADKLLVNTALLLLTVNGDIHYVAFLLMLWRDMIVDGIRMVAASQNQVIAASLYGKLKTILQMTAIILLLLRNWPFHLFNFPMSKIVLWLAVLTSIASGFDYLVKSKDVWYKTK
ncbi:MAG TPA: CDP-diacylglycerol--glycerol-3-phosphate 3-phosphatidyltransferase [Erysipelothrix sp.]|nr:CDP-diacylglycerol--glycerol-3-phosphate 3-phosphatidyltransferase [Erysipelothrix sp.]